MTVLCCKLLLLVNGKFLKKRELGTKYIGLKLSGVWPGVHLLCDVAVLFELFIAFWPCTLSVKHLTAGGVEKLCP